MDDESLDPLHACRGPPRPLRHLHAQVDQRGPRIRLQHPRRAARGRGVLRPRHAHEGWEALPDRYDDGGFTGGNIDRPALQRLLADIEAGKIDMVVVYKVDRLSRSLLDFAQLLALFEAKGVGFVSTTQQFNTRDAMGRLTLNIVVSFAQFEREMIADRTRDKMGAARKRGKWLGSRPPLGYAGDRERMRLVVVPEEAEQVRSMFQLYLRLGSAAEVATRVNALGWTRKQAKPRTGHVLGGVPRDAKDVHMLLRSALCSASTRSTSRLRTGPAPRPQP